MGAAHDDPLGGLTVLERGWLSSNNLVIHPAAGEAGAVLVDSGHGAHAAQTLALVRQALGGRPLARVVNTHLHSDHCGGNAVLQQHFGVPVWVAPGQAAGVQAWAQTALVHEGAHEVVPRFRADGELRADTPLRAGGRDWQVLQAPGHDPDSVVLFDAAHGLLLSADALWENGFGIVFPELAGEPGFDDVAATLDLIAGLPVRLVVPGHGRPFADVAGALARARARLAAFQADPARHARHAVKVMLKYHLMTRQAMPVDELLAWAAQAPVTEGAWQRHPPSGGLDRRAWLTELLEELARAGALRRDGAQVIDLG